MPDGILDFLEFAAIVTLALPVALLGVRLLTQADVVGGVAFLGVSVGMVALDRIVLSPRDIVVDAVSGLAGRLVGTDRTEK